MPTTIYWKTMDGSFVQMTPTLAGQIFNTAAGWVLSVIGRKMIVGSALKMFQIP